MKKIKLSSKTHKKLNIVISCLVAVVWGVLLFYALGSTDTVAKQNYATTSSVQMNTTSYDNTAIPQIKTSSPFHHNTTAVSEWSYSQSKPMSGTSMRIHETSANTVHSVGGSGNGVATTSGGNAAHNISSGGNMVNLSSSLALAEPGASTANDVAQLAAAPGRHAAPSGPRRVDQGNKPDGPFEDPIGDAVLPLTLLALAFCGVIYFRRRKVNS